MLCLEGKGEEAVRIAALGSAYAAALAIPLSIRPVFYPYPHCNLISTGGSESFSLQ